MGRGNWLVTNILYWQYRWSLSVILKYFCVEYGKVTPCYYYNVWLDVLCHIISWRAAILFINCQQSSGWQYLISNGSRCPLIVFTVISTADTVSLTLVWSGLFDRMECLNLCKESKYDDLTNTWSFRNCYISDIFESSIWTLDLQMFQTFENITLPTSNTVTLYDVQL